MLCLFTRSCPTLCDPVDCSPPGSFVSGNSPGRYTGVGCHALLQGILPTQGSNPGLPHCRWILYHLSHWGTLITNKGAWWPAVHGVAKTRTQLSDFSFTFHFHALEKEMATHSSVLAWRIPEMGEPSGLPSVGSHRVRHDRSDLAAVAALYYLNFF